MQNQDSSMPKASYYAVSLVSVLAIPIAFLANTFASSHHVHGHGYENIDPSVALFLAGVIALSLVCLITRFFIGEHGDSFFHGRYRICFK